MDNLIGELDLFQKEHEAKQLQQHEKDRKHQKLLNGHANYNNSCSEYQTPSPITTATSNTIITQQNTINNNIHNDSFISTSTTITGTFSHHAFNGTAIASDDSEIKSASLNYSITSNASMTTTLSDLQKFNCSDFTDNKSPYNDHDLSSETGFENPSFRHLNDTSSSASNIVLIRDDDLPPSYYSRNSTDTVVVLRSKMGSNNNSMTDLSQIDTPTFEQKMQRLSSFKFDNNFSIATPNGSPSHYYSANNNNNNNSSSSPSIPSISKGSLSSHGSFGALMYGQIEDDTDTKNAAALTSNATSNNFNVNNNVNVITTASNVKPTLAPRPASLLSGIFK